MRLLFDTDGSPEDLAVLAKILQKEPEMLVIAAGRKADAEETAGKIRGSLPGSVSVIPGSNHPYAVQNPYHPELPVNDMHTMFSDAVSFLDSDEKTDVILTAGASDLALLVHACPDAKQHISRILFAGGCYCFGDVTPVAEANAFYDSEGLQYLLHAGIPFYFLPLELKEETGLSYALLCLLALEHPESFRFVRYRAETETYADYTRGMTVIYRNGVDHYDYNDDEIASAVQVTVKESDKNAFYPEADPDAIRKLAEGGAL